MDDELKKAQQLIDFIYESPTAFHAVESVKKMLMSSGFTELKEEDSWTLEKLGRYFFTKNQSALIAFVVGTGELEEEGFRIIGAHTDSPGFRVKPNPEMEVEGAYIKLNTEVYGGPIINTWLDRPLSIAGRVTLKSENPFYPEIKLLNIERPILVIPNLAIHMNRNVNSGVELNRQKDILPLLSTVNKELEKGQYLIKIIAKDLSMVHSGIKALTEASSGKATNVMVCFDNEEVGSTTKQGANSPLLSGTLERIGVIFG
jgi:aspartyl aminopeptidase